MKWSGRPIVAKAKVQGFRQIENCTPAKLKQTALGYKLYSLEEYWNSLHPVFYGMTIYLESEEWLDNPFYPLARSRGESWVIVDSGELESLWLKPSHKDNPEEIIRNSGKPSRTIPASLRFAVLRRDGFTCIYCGRKPPEVKLHVVHIIPFSKGGETVFDNLRTSCEECNLGKGANKL